jgi:aminobenzoyl-glutamate utilization protein B
MLLSTAVAAAEERATDAYLDQTRERWTTLAKKIWDTPETALNEKKSAQALVDALQKEGFKVTWGVGGEPTAFVATAGSGSPTVAFLAEYDALPGLSQKAGSASKGAVVDAGPGHGCGHNLLGTAATAAAIAANRDRQSRKLPGPSSSSAPGRGGPLRQDVHDPRRRLQGDRRRPRLAPR